MEGWYCITIVLLLHYAGWTDGVCQDLNTNACVLMHAEDPNLCKNEVLAMSACRKYCNLCPLTCFHCDNVTTNAADCATMRVCPIGERCLLGKYRAAADGHYEYKMNCASYDRCEGKEYLNIIGRRGIEQRTISTECCTTNYCNNPAFYTTTAAPTTATVVTTTTTTPKPTTTIPVCVRDIEFLVQDSSAQDHYDTIAIKDFLKGFSGRLAIGHHDNMVSVSNFDSGVHDHTDFQTDRTRLYTAIDNLDFNYRREEVDITHVVDNLRGKLGNDRPNIADVAIFVFDDTAREHLSIHHNSHNPTDLPHDVIVIGVGSSNLATSFTNIATDAGHVLSVKDYSLLPTLENQILSLICA